MTISALPSAFSQRPARGGAGWRRRAGFNMLEVLVSVGIFAIAFVAVAAIFPAAAMLQKQTIDEFTARQLADNARAMLQARKFQLADLTATNTEVNFFADANLKDDGQWPLASRAYPTRAGNGASLIPPGQRPYFWVPVYRKTKANASAGDCLVYIFTLRRGQTIASPNYPANPNSSEWANPDDIKNYAAPGVKKISSTDLAQYVKVGDQILDQNGNIEIYKTPFTPKTSYYFVGIPPTSGALSPVIRIELLTNAVE